MEPIDEWTAMVLRQKMDHVAFAPDLLLTDIITMLQALPPTPSALHDAKFEFHKKRLGRIVADVILNATAGIALLGGKLNEPLSQGQGEETLSIGEPYLPTIRVLQPNAAATAEVAHPVELPKISSELLSTLKSFRDLVCNAISSEDDDDGFASFGMVFAVPTPTGPFDLCPMGRNIPVRRANFGLFCRMLDLVIDSAST